MDDVRVGEAGAVGLRHLRVEGVDLRVAGTVAEVLGGDLPQAFARDDDMLEIRGRMARLGRSSMLFRVEMYRREEHLITGEIVYVCADPATQKSAPIPAQVRETIDAWEVVKPAG